MIEQFKQDFWQMARENKGYYSWAKQARYELHLALRHKESFCRMCDSRQDVQIIVQELFEKGLALHPLFDLTFEAFARAESRLGLRFIPQRSNEERLTGHLISELEAALHLATPAFSRLAVERYKNDKKLDFAYQDLSQGGPLEKLTGGDFGLIVSVDLPDKPIVIRTAAFQAKKITNKIAQIPKAQFDMLVENFEAGAYYIFYDTDRLSLAPPLVVPASAFANKRNENTISHTFSADSEFIFRNGLPLSLWFLTEFSQGLAGKKFSSFEFALKEMQANRWNKSENIKADLLEPFVMTRLAMVSLGAAFNMNFDNDNQPSFRLTK